MPAKAEEEFLSPEEVSARYGERISIRTLANWRSNGDQGPPFTKVGGRIAYPKAKLIEWEGKRTFTKTPEKEERKKKK